MSDPQKPDDHELEDFISGKSDVSHAYHSGPAPSVPPELDAAILNLARAQVQKPAVRPSFARRARVPLALAATVLLGFGMINLMREDKAVREVAMLPPPAAPASVPMVMDEAAVAERSSVERSLKKESAAGARAKERPHRDAPAQKPAAKDEAAITTQPAPAAAPRPSPAMSMGAVAPIEQENKVVAPTTAAESDRRDNAAPKAKMSRQELMMAPAREPAGAASSDALTKAQPLPPESATDWLARIRKLRDQPNLPAAREQLEAFKKAYPHYPLPEDVKSLSEPAAPTKQ